MGKWSNSIVYFLSKVADERGKGLEEDSEIMNDCRMVLFPKERKHLMEFH